MRVSEAAFIVAAKWRIVAEVGAGEVVEQDIECGVEEISTTAIPVIEQGRLVFEQLVMKGNSLWLAAILASLPSRSTRAHCSNRYRRSRQSLPGDGNRWATSTNRTRSHRVQLRPFGKRANQR